MPENQLIRQLPRDLIERILQDPGFVRTFEAMMRGVGETLPENTAIAQDTADHALIGMQSVEVEQETPAATQEIDWFDICHPIGCTVIRDDLVDPGSTAVYGRGTWSKINPGKFLVTYLAGDPDFGTIGATGGAKTITIADHDPHTHDVTAAAIVSSGEVQSGTGSFVVDGITPTPATSTVENPTPLVHVDGTSGLPDIEILPPFAVFALWKRTA